MEAVQSASREPVQGIVATLRRCRARFRNYWYPVLLSRQLGSKPRANHLCGERIVLVREGDRVYALHDRCPHRASPFSQGRREFPGMLTCAYHGWTYDVKTGRLEVVLTDARTRRSAARSTWRPPGGRAGRVIWVYVGDQPPPPVETDIPAELLRPTAVVEGPRRDSKGKLAYACENSVDEGHAKVPAPQDPLDLTSQSSR